MGKTDGKKECNKKKSKCLQDNVTVGLACKAALYCPFGNEGDLSALHISALRLLVRVCVAEAGSMPTAHSRSPLYVRGGRLHALEKLFVTSTRRHDPQAALFAQVFGMQSAREV